MDGKGRWVNRVFIEKLWKSVKYEDISLDSCLTFFSFPEKEWISLRTTNVIERLNKEFKRRTRSMDIVAGEGAWLLFL